MNQIRELGGECKKLELPSVYASATFSGSCPFHKSCAVLTLALAVASVNGGTSLVGGSELVDMVRARQLTRSCEPRRIRLAFMVANLGAGCEGVGTDKILQLSCRIYRALARDRRA
jgi:hypothetical protein